MHEHAKSLVIIWPPLQSATQNLVSSPTPTYLGHSYSLVVMKGLAMRVGGGCSEYIYVARLECVVRLTGGQPLDWSVLPTHTLLLHVPMGGCVQVTTGIFLFHTVRK